MRTIRKMLLVLLVLFSAKANAQLSNGMAATGVLGQPNLTTQGSTTGASGMGGATGVVVDPVSKKVFVVDRYYNRVLRYTDVTTLTTGQAAEAVLGQPDFATTTTGNTNVKMNNPIDAAFNSSTGELWVGEYGNNRVVKFNNATTIASGSPADVVLGQAGFGTSTAATTQTGMNGATGVALGSDGTLWVAQFGANRVTYYKNASTLGNGAPADGVLGQTSYTTTTAATTQAGLRNPNNVYVDALGNLYISDYGNKRVLRHLDAVNKANGANADLVFLQPNFTTGTAACTASGANQTRDITVDRSGRLLIADEAYNRILIFSNAGAISTNGVAANYVIGQPDFTTCSSGVSATKMDFPRSVTTYEEYNGTDPQRYIILVAEWNNERVTWFDVPNIALPIELAEFTAHVNQSDVTLNWQTASENGLSAFEVQVHQNGEWTTVATVDASGNAASYSQVVNGLGVGTHTLRLKLVDRDGSVKYSNQVTVTVEVPGAFVMNAAYPNPFNPQTTITFAVAQKQAVSMTLYNALGQKVNVLYQATPEANTLQTVRVDARNLTSGTYYVRLVGENFASTQNITVVK